MPPKKVSIPAILDGKKKQKQKLKERASVYIDAEAKEVGEEEEEYEDDEENEEEMDIIDGNSGEDDVEEVLSQSMSPSAAQRRRRIISPANSDEEDEEPPSKKKGKKSATVSGKKGKEDLTLEELTYMQELVSAYEMHGKKLIGGEFKDHVMNMKDLMVSKPKGSTSKAYLSVLAKNIVMQNRENKNNKETIDTNHEEEREEEASQEGKKVWAVKEVPYSVREKERKKFKQSDLIQEQCSLTFNLSHEADCYVYKGKWNTQEDSRKFVRLNFTKAYIGNGQKKKFQYTLTPLEVEALAIHFQDILTYVRTAEKEEEAIAARSKKN